MMTSLVLMWALFQGDDTGASPLPVDEAIEMLDRRSRTIQSFDVRMSVTTSRMFRTEGLPSSIDVRATDSRPPRITWVSLPPGVEVVTTERFRQVFLSRGDENDPRRRVEQVSVDVGEAISVLTFDGEVRQSYDPSGNSGSIGGPPPEDDSYVRLGGDYLKLLGTHHNGRQIAQYFRERETTATEVGELLLLEAPPSPQIREIPMNGYRAWLDPAHDMSLTRFEHYQVIPSEWDGREIGGDDLERVVYGFAIDEFQNVEPGVWVPVRATTTRNRPDWNSRDGTATLKLYEVVAVVDVERSRWNTDVDEDEFAIDYPDGTRVFDQRLEAYFTAEDGVAIEDRVYSPWWTSDTDGQRFRLFSVSTDLQRLLTRDVASAYLVVDAASMLRDGRVDADSPVWNSIRESLRSDEQLSAGGKRVAFQSYYPDGSYSAETSGAIAEMLAVVISEEGNEGISMGSRFSDDSWTGWINAAAVLDGEETGEPSIGSDTVRVCPVKTGLSRLLLGSDDPIDCYVSIDLRETDGLVGISPEVLDDIIVFVSQLKLEQKREIYFHIRGFVNEFENRNSLEKLGIPASLHRDLGFDSWILRRTNGPTR